MGMQLEFGTFSFVEQKNTREGGSGKKSGQNFVLKITSTAKAGNHVQFSNMIVDKLGLSSLGLVQIPHPKYAVLGVVSEDKAVAFKKAKVTKDGTPGKKAQKMRWELLVSKLNEVGTTKEVDTEVLEKPFTQKLDLVSVAIVPELAAKGVTALYAIVKDGEGEFSESVETSSESDESDDVDDDSEVEDTTSDSETEDAPVANNASAPADTDW